MRPKLKLSQSPKQDDLNCVLALQLHGHFAKPCRDIYIRLCNACFVGLGVLVSHSIFGTAQTINSANYVYFCALQEFLKLNNPEAIWIYTDELLNLHRGQGMDLFWRDTLTYPSENEYLEMVGNKTGGLFRLAINSCAPNRPPTISPPPTAPTPPKPTTSP